MKLILAVGFIRLCFVLALQIQMLFHVDPDGSFNVEMLFAVLLVDGGGMITATTFLMHNPILGSLMNRMRLFCNDVIYDIRGPHSEMPWQGDEEDSQRRESLATRVQDNSISTPRAPSTSSSVSTDRIEDQCGLSDALIPRN